MIRHSEIEDEELHKLLKNGTIKFAGWPQGMMYGLLNCKSGKRQLKRENRVFASEAEFKRKGYRPCGHCMYAKYQAWKRRLIAGRIHRVGAADRVGRRILKSLESGRHNP